jgi:DNA ligase-1
MTTSHFSQILHRLENIASRNEMTQVLAEAIRELGVEEIDKAVYILLGNLGPAFAAVEFNMSQKLALRALAECVKAPNGKTGEQVVQELFSKLGDVGLVAEHIMTEMECNSVESGSQINATTSIVEMYNYLRELAALAGKGSQEEKMQRYVGSVQRLDGVSARYVSRLVVGKLRLGLSDKTLLDALSYSVSGDKSLRTELERAYGAYADIGELAKLVKRNIADEAALRAALNNIQIAAGTPVAAKLVEREADAAAVFERLGTHLVQPKLDGMRAQIHFRRKGDAPVAAVYSRNMESLTEMFPDILAAASRLDADSFIIDSEVIGFDYENQAYLPFQETMQRRRKYDIDEMAVSIPVRAMAFDLIYLNGEDISHRPVQERVELLRDLLARSGVSEIQLLESLQVDSTEALEQYFLARVGEGLEGVICKKLDTAYDPGTRNFDWIKLKANTRSDLVDTLDVVVIGYYVGRGARAASGIGALLTAVYDSEADAYMSVAKVGSGFTDIELAGIAERLKPLVVASKPDNVHVANSLLPDVWIRPEIVMEVTADEITRSPAHTAAKGIAAAFETAAGTNIEKGLSLRFPRLKVWDRDKKAHQATTVAELLRMYDLRKGKIIS